MVQTVEGVRCFSGRFYYQVGGALDESESGPQCQLLAVKCRKKTT